MHRAISGTSPVIALAHRRPRDFVVLPLQQEHNMPASVRTIWRAWQPQACITSPIHTVHVVKRAHIRSSREAIDRSLELLQSTPEQNIIIDPDLDEGATRGEVINRAA